MPPTTISRAAPSDLDDLLPLFAGYLDFYGQTFDDDAADPAEARQFLHDRLAREQSVLFLARRDGTAVGFTQLYPSFSSVSMQRVWILNDLFVATPARKIGVATALLETARQFAVETGALRLELVTGLENHSAQALYEKLGWQLDERYLSYVLNPY